MEGNELEGLTREELIALAERLGIARPRTLTVPELVDEIVSRTAASERDRVRSRGWLGRARDLLAGVIERGLHLPEVARSVRGSEGPLPNAPSPLATVTLAEIYAAQGHLEKAIGVLDEVITREPEHAEARALKQRLVAQAEGREERRAPASEPPAEVEDAAGEEPAAVSAEAEEQEARPAVEMPLVPEAAAAPLAVPGSSASDEVEPVVAAAGVAPGQADGVEAGEAEVEEDLDELPLPDRYNVDEIVAVSVDPTTIYLYWEVRPTSMARARAHRPEGALVVRMISVTPSWQGPLVDQRDLPIDALYGDAYVRNLKPGSNVRVTVGWLASGDLEPFAIGAEVTTPRASLAPEVAQQVARWTPEPPPAPAPPAPAFHAPSLPSAATAGPMGDPPAQWAEDTAVEWPIDAGAMQPQVNEAAVPEVRPGPRREPPPAQPSGFVPSWPVFEVGQGEAPKPWVPGQHGPMRWGGGTTEWARDEATEWTRDGGVSEWTRAGGVSEWTWVGGVSEWSRGGASEWMRGGSSEWMRGGSSERLRGGASERLRGGASERLRGGASERVRGGASERVRGGASERVRGGASEWSRGGASERVRRGR